MSEEREALVLVPTRPLPNTTVDHGLAFELSMSDLGEVPRPEGEWAEGVDFVFCFGIRFLVFVPIQFLQRQRANTNLPFAYRTHNAFFERGGLFFKNTEQMKIYVISAHIS